MRKKLQKYVLGMVLAVTVSLTAPTSYAAIAADEIKIVEQEAGSKSKSLTGLYLEVGGIRDLKFLGAPSNWRSLKPTWSSSDKKIVAVDQNGVVKAVAKGTAKVTFSLSNGTSRAIDVTVGVPITLGTSKNKSIEKIDLQVSDTLDLGFHGMKGWNKKTCTCYWSITGDAAKIDSNGLVTALKPGTATIKLYIKNNTTGVLYNTVSSKLTVSEKNYDGLKMVTESFVDELNYMDTLEFGWTYYASVAPVSHFVTADGGYAVAYHGIQYGGVKYQEADEITILLYDENLILADTVKISKEYRDVGTVTCDEEGNFYVVYGIKNETEDVSKEVMRIVKYSSTGKKIKSVSFTGDETGWDGIMKSAKESGSGTKIPFDASNCSAVVSDGMLVCAYGREMYNGHQSSNSLYVQTDTMKKLKIDTIYTSHSFDQQVISTMDGGYLFVDHGDGYARAFTLYKLFKGADQPSQRFASFHFREGSDRSHGYNETYAQLGGIAELSNSYVLVGASERTLSLDVAPTDRDYCGMSEPRDLFIQYIEKDFPSLAGEVCYAVKGETRAAVGKRPEAAKTPLFLEEGTTDYGVIWLTEYDKDHMVYNPKVATTESGEVAILWNKVNVQTAKVVDTYYMLLDEQGNILQEAISIGRVPLSENEPMVYADGCVYWSVTEGKKLNTYRLTVKKMAQ